MMVKQTLIKKALLIVLALSAFFIAHFSLISNTHAQECLTPREYEYGHTPNNFSDPEGNDCSISDDNYSIQVGDPKGWNPNDGVQTRYENFIDHADVVCVDNPELVYRLLGERRFLDKIAGQTRSVTNQLRLESIGNVALDGIITQVNQDQLPPNLLRATSYFDNYNPGTAYSQCAHEGITDPITCAEHLNTCLINDGDCRDNAFLSSNFFQRTTTLRQQHKRIQSRCQSIVGSVGGFLEEATPKEHVPIFDEAGSNFFTLCSELPETYEEFQELDQDTQFLLSAIPPNVTLERAFLVIASQPELELTNLWTRFFRAFFKPPDLQVIPFFVTGIRGAKLEAQREAQHMLPLKTGERTFQEVEFSTYEPLGDFIPEADNDIINNPTTFATYRTYQPVIDKIIKSRRTCDNVDVPLLEFMGGYASTHQEEAADLSWETRLPDDPEELNDIEQGSDRVYQGWILYPKDFRHLAIYGGADPDIDAPTNGFYTLNQLTQLEEEVNLPIDSRQGQQTASFISPAFDIPETCEFNVDTLEIECDQTTVEIKQEQADSLANTTTSGGDITYRQNRIANKNLLLPLDHPERIEECYYTGLTRQNPALPGYLGGMASNPQDADFCAPILSGTDASLSCNDNTTYTPDTQSACAGGKLGFNWGYGHAPSPGACLDAQGKPVTFLFDLKGSNAPDYLEGRHLNKTSCFNQATKQIVRVFNWNASTPDSDIESGARYIASNFPGAYIVFGNELNNLEAEYEGCSGLESCGQKYADQFDLFRNNCSGCKLAAAPVDTSNANFDAIPFLNAAAPAYRDATFFAANAYEGVGCHPDYDPTRCTAQSYRWVIQHFADQGINISGKEIILTEYGLAPGNDKNLAEVANFITNVPGDVSAATPLVKSYCIGSSEWLRFNCNTSQFVDANDTAFTKSAGPTTSGSGGSSGGSFPSTSTSSNADINRIASQYNVPAKFIEAIWAAESSQAPSGSNCGPEFEGNYGAGPMGINDITWDHVDPSRSLNRCNLPDAFELSARVLVSWQSFRNGTYYDRSNPLSPNHPTVTLQDLPTLGYYYQGHANGCQNDTNTNRRWGMSYCDAVQYYIDNGQLPPRPQSLLQPLRDIFTQLFT